MNITWRNNRTSRAALCCRIAGWIALGAIGAALALLLSCGDNDGGPGCTQGRHTIQETINALAASYDNKDIAKYTSCLSDDYRFEFAESDWDSAGVLPSDPSWSRASDLAATAALFDSPTVTSITFGWTAVAPESISGDSATIVINPAIDLTIQPSGQEPFTLMVRHSLLEVRLVDVSGGDGCWAISSIREYVNEAVVAGAAGVEPVTLGTMKWKFAQPNRETPKGLITYFSKSWDDRDLDAYGECLDEGYTFVFTPNDWDAAGVTPEAPYWGRTLDLERTRKLFESAAIDEIDFRIRPVTGYSGPDSLIDVTYGTHIVVTLAAPGEEPIVYSITRTRLEFLVARDPAHSDLWVIRRITEILPERGATPAGAAVPISTLGYLKAVFK